MFSPTSVLPSIQWNWTFSQTHTFANNDINANFVLPYNCAFLH